MLHKTKMVLYGTCLLFSSLSGKLVHPVLLVDPYLEPWLYFTDHFTNSILVQHGDTNSLSLIPRPPEAGLGKSTGFCGTRKIHFIQHQSKRSKVVIWLGDCGFADVLTSTFAMETCRHCPDLPFRFHWLYNPHRELAALTLLPLGSIFSTNGLEIANGMTSCVKSMQSTTRSSVTLPSISLSRSWCSVAVSVSSTSM